ncbi:MAG: hypothetical protein HN617_06835 [Planctomycetaceae bacterium]|nr:hypothetical protein [Planctomycetaceae bacterium]MBT4846701.1 hypothetical protein [Planctomycetaceae bacterium]MBT5598924.1 hypothetical protein [Planctomycetaceae bacterium]MBT6847948.1 hypothetical protein [Planctomycetaceae bacterium]MBT7254900.1 hypothetical protein [Planctomycetaceae bacterium]
MRDSQFKYGRCRAAASTVDITPPDNMYHRMWGAAVHDQATGVHQSLEVNLLWLQSGTTAEGDIGVNVLILSVDHCLFWAADLEPIKQSLSAATGLGPEQIVIYFTHTHAAGLMDSTRAELPGGELIAPYLAEIGAKVSVAAAALPDKLEEMWLTTSNGHCSLAQSRDYWDEASDSYVCGYNPVGNADSTVMVIRLCDLGGNAQAVLVNYACHPTTLAWENRLISPDYVGPMRRTLRHALGKIPVVFIQGASGDVGPREGFVGDVEVAVRNGRQLGLAALEALAAMPVEPAEFSYDGAVVSGATIGTWSYKPFSSDQVESMSRFESIQTSFDLEYRSDLGTREQTQHDLDALLAAGADSNGGVDAARNQRALVERLQRKLTRFRGLEEGDCFHYQLRAWRIGDVCLLAFNGEMYNMLQLDLRAAFPGLALMVGTLADGSSCWYLPNRESYGKGLYQEDASIIACGGLEQLRDAAIAMLNIQGHQ